MVDDKKNVEKQGFFARLMDFLDKKIEAKAKSGGSCCCSSKSKDGENKKCC
jgi:hypothetical protein